MFLYVVFRCLLDRHNGNFKMYLNTKYNALENIKKSVEPRKELLTNTNASLLFKSRKHKYTKKAIRMCFYC